MAPNKSFCLKFFVPDKTNILFVISLFSYFILGTAIKACAFDIQEEFPKITLGKELWTAGHEGGSLAEWHADEGGGEFNSGTGNSHVSREQARTGKYSLKMSINTKNDGGHGTRNYRWKELENHTDLIFTQYFFFPHRIDLDPNNDWFNLVQTKAVKYAPGGPDSGPDQINSPHFVLGLKVRGDPGTAGANYLSLSELQKFWGGQSDVFWEAAPGIDLPLNKWVKVQIRIIQDRGEKGRILVWQDDLLIMDTGFRNTLRPEADVNMYSINAYADKTFPSTSIIYVDDLSINLPGSPEVPIPVIAP
ncbi:heparin lyase I family protein [Cyclobacterium plantarum]|uniref:Polysaccharide lyase n=1 Tax=Cyclobacterium plantarum TaxID=2716263 RepID=A0ABX0H6Q4_9BACT|nr:heparin lyase I family protein [Cyclobacterium plantarum]NHE57115.1 hypothetical protein [Cyclobacterium plantarum]